MIAAPSPEVLESLGSVLTDRVQRFLGEHPPPGQLLLCAVTGSHLYGFSSPDSDVDLKGIHQAPTTRILSLRPGRANHDVLTDYEGTECDLTTHELAQALKLLLAGNGNMLERIHAPLQLVRTPLVASLQTLSRRILSRACYGHYRGYLQGMKREHTRDGRAKSLLYTYRVALTGVHLLRTGEVEARLPVLACEYGMPEVLELVDYKRATAEKGAGPAGLSAVLREGWPRLEAMLVEARDGSALPEKAHGHDIVDEFLVAQRRWLWEA